MGPREFCDCKTMDDSLLQERVLGCHDVLVDVANHVDFILLVVEVGDRQKLVDVSLEYLKHVR